MKKFTLKAVSLILSSLIFLSALGGCNSDGIGINSDNTSDGISQSAENAKKKSSVSDKTVIEGKEYESGINYLKTDGHDVSVIGFQIAKYFLQGNKEELKKYFDSEADWERNEANIPDTNRFNDLYYFTFDFLTVFTDDSGKENINLVYDVILGDRDHDSYDYIEITLYRSDAGEWVTGGVVKTK